MLKREVYIFPVFLTRTLNLLVCVFVRTFFLAKLLLDAFWVLLRVAKSVYVFDFYNLLFRRQLFKRFYSKNLDLKKFEIRNRIMGCYLVTLRSANFTFKNDYLNLINPSL